MVKSWSYFKYKIFSSQPPVGSGVECSFYNHEIQQEAEPTWRKQIKGKAFESQVLPPGSGTISVWGLTLMLHSITMKQNRYIFYFFYTNCSYSETKVNNRTKNYRQFFPYTVIGIKEYCSHMKKQIFQIFKNIVYSLVWICLPGRKI